MNTTEIILAIFVFLIWIDTVIMWGRVVKLKEKLRQHDISIGDITRRSIVLASNDESKIVYREGYGYTLENSKNHVSIDESRIIALEKHMGLKWEKESTVPAGYKKIESEEK